MSDQKSHAIGGVGQASKAKNTGGMEDTGDMERVGDVERAGDVERICDMENTSDMEYMDDAEYTDDMRILNGTENKLILPRYDVVFKALFKDESNTEAVADFLRAALGIPEDEVLEDIVVIDPEMPPGAKDEKISVLDVLLKIPGQGTVNVEMQLRRERA
jgi:hypothetical protein